jgi:hypothetical protein
MTPFLAKVVRKPRMFPLRYHLPTRSASVVKQDPVEYGPWERWLAPRTAR